MTTTSQIRSRRERPAPGKWPSAPRAALRTLGVEEEFLLVDAGTLRPAAAAEEVLTSLDHLAARSRSAGHAPITFHAEMKREQIEVVSPPLRTRSELVAVIAEGRSVLDRAATAAGTRAVPLATSPDACVTHLADSPRYDEMAVRFAATAREQLTCGMHVHVAVESPEEGVGVLDRLRPWLPVVLALSANSPFWQGADTGFASYRYQAWGRWPTSGPTDVFGSVDTYRREVAASVQAGVCLDEGMIYFDARLSAHVPTVEIRIADVCLRADDAVTLPLLIRALVDRAAADWRAGIPPLMWPTTMLRLASWRASKCGLEGELMHPVVRHLVPAEAAVEALVHYVDGHYFTAVEQDQVEEGIADILAFGNGAIRQRAAGGTTEAVRDAVRQGMETPPCY